MTIKKNLIGGHHLSYTCPTCGDALRSPLPEAGTEQTCPKCGAGHTVPGKEQVAKFLLAKKQQKEEEEAARQAEIQRRQAEQEKQQREWRGGAPLITPTNADAVSRPSTSTRKKTKPVTESQANVIICLLCMMIGCLSLMRSGCFRLTKFAHFNAGNTKSPAAPTR